MNEHIECDTVHDTWAAFPTDVIFGMKQSVLDAFYGL